MIRGKHGKLHSLFWRARYDFSSQSRQAQSHIEKVQVVG